MPPVKSEPAPEISDFEKERAANIAERDALLKKLTLEAQSTGLFSPKPTAKPSSQKAKKSAPAKKVKSENVAQAPRRTSARLAGLTADSEVAKRKAVTEHEAQRTAAEAKRMRVSGDLNMGDIGAGLLGTDVKEPARPYARTFGEEDIKKTTDKELKALREKMSGLQLWQSWEPNSKFRRDDFSGTYSSNVYKGSKLRLKGHMR